MVRSNLSSATEKPTTGTDASVKSLRPRSSRTIPRCTGILKIAREYFCPKSSTCVTYTDDLETLAVGQEDGTIQLFHNSQPGTLLSDREVISENEPCTDVKIKSSPKGGYHKTILASYISGHIKLWDTAIGKCIFTMKENRQIYSLNYHPRSNRFVTVGTDFKAYVYDEELRVSERILACSEIFGSTNGRADCVCCAKFHPKNPFELISSGMDGIIRFWDIRAPFAVRRIANVSNYGEGLDISDDGNLILSCESGRSNAILRLHDYHTGKLLKECHNPGSFVVGTVSNLPCCVTSFSLNRKLPQHKVEHSTIPKLVISAAEKVVELEPSAIQQVCDKGGFYYMNN